MLVLKEYLDLGELENTQIGWSFRRVRADVPAQTLAQLSCIEVRVEGLLEHDFLYKPTGYQHLVRKSNLEFREKASRRLDQIAWALNDFGPKHIYLVHVSLLQQRNRVRSYKGIFPLGGEIRKCDFYQQEIDRENQSFFVGIAKARPENKTECLSLARDMRRSFLLFTEIDMAALIWERYHHILTNCIDFDSVLIIDSSVLVPKIIDSKHVILRYGYDVAGDNWMNLRLFISRSGRLEWRQKLDRILESQQVTEVVE